MNYKYWEKVLIKEISAQWKRSRKFLPCHGPEHHIRVWQMAKPFGLRKKADMEVLVASCLLHDIVAFNPSPAENHHEASAKIAVQILKKVKFPPEKIKKVSQIISQHRSSYKGKETLEGRIMKSFDKIDAFGPLGVYRILTPMSIRGLNIKEIIKRYLYQGGLTEKWKSISFLELRNKHKKDYLYAIKYFKDLANQLKI